jgi:alpha-tubulin suppressor-like RCC1 family protein
LELTASLCAHAPGTAEVIVEVRQAGLEPAEYRVPVVVSRGDWPEVLTVTESDTVGVKLTNVESAAAELGVEWRSADTGVLKVAKLGALGAVVTAHARGSADVIATVDAPGSSQTEFRIPITVGPVEIDEAAAWPDTLTTAQTDTVTVTIPNLSGVSAAGIDVEWTSSNAAVLEVTELDSLSAMVTAIGRGSAEIVARVDEAGFEPAEYRKQVLVLQGWGNVSAGGGVTGYGTGPITGGGIHGHSCGVTTAGEVYCWGDGSFGQLGTGASGGGVASPVPMPVFTGLRFREVVAGQFHNCACSGACGAFTDDQVVFCWGWNQDDQIGAGLPDVQPVPAALTSIGGFWAVSLGGYHSCGARNRDVWSDVLVNDCWGYNGYGQLGEGLDTLFNIHVSAGAFHTCAITTDAPAGTAFCWGRGTEGQLGDGSGTDRSTPMPVAGGLSFAALSPGGLHTCGLTPVGQAYCWGSNTEGQLGDGSTTDRLTPVPVSGGLTFKAITAGGGYPNDDGQGTSQPEGGFTCALTLDGRAYCWGENLYGQLGDGTGQPSSVPVAVVGNHSFSSLAAGHEHACGVTAGQAIYCWGLNAVGQLGGGVDSQGLHDTPLRVAEPEIRR